MPKEGMFIRREGSIYVQNDVTKEEIIFVVDDSVNLYLRSMLEEDASVVAEAYGANARKRKALEKSLAEKESELYNFVIGEKNVVTQKGRRKIVGDCQINKNGETAFLQLYIPNIKTQKDYAIFLKRRAVHLVNTILKEELRLDCVPEVCRVSKKY